MCVIHIDTLFPSLGVVIISSDALNFLIHACSTDVMEFLFVSFNATTTFSKAPFICL